MCCVAELLQLRSVGLTGCAAQWEDGAADTVQVCLGEQIQKMGTFGNRFSAEGVGARPPLIALRRSGLVSGHNLVKLD